MPADVLAEHLAGHLATGAWGFLDLISGRPLLRTPALTETCRRLRTQGLDGLVDQLRLVDGPLLSKSSELPGTAAALATLRARALVGPPAPPERPSLRDLLDQARTGTPEQVHRALTRLAEEYSEQTTELGSLVGELLHHPRPGVRLHAHRTSRAMLDRQTYFHHTSVLLDDPKPDIRRLAIRTLCHAAWAPAIPAVVGLLEHPNPTVRGAAADGLTRMGAPTIPALRRAADHARPDRRSRYTELLERITAAQA